MREEGASSFQALVFKGAMVYAVVAWKGAVAAHRISWRSLFVCELCEELLLSDRQSA